MARFISPDGSDAAGVSYDNAISGLAATNAKAAIDELTAEKQAINSGKSTAEDLGAISSGTTTPEPSSGGLKTITNGGAFTWAAPTEEGAYLATLLNNASAGTITTSGFDKQDSANFNTTVNNEFEVVVTNDGVRKIMTVRALQ